MDYKIIITEAAEQQLDNLITYLLFELQNEQAAIHLLNQVEQIYDRLEENPFQFPLNNNLINKDYREAILTDMSYVIIFSIENECVYIVGYFSSIGKLYLKIALLNCALESGITFLFIYCP